MRCRRVRPAQPATPPGPTVGDPRRGRGHRLHRRRRATFTARTGVWHLLAGYDLSRDRHIKARKGCAEFLAFCRYLRTLHPPLERIAIVLDNFSPHLSTNTDPRVGDWAAANNVELAYVPTYASWLNRISAPVHRAALLHPRRHRPPQPPRTGPNDPPLHRLAQPSRP
jgi:hypothetical protein